MRQQTHGLNAARNVVFMPGIFNEAKGLLADAHDYFGLFSADDQSRLSDELKKIYTQEMSRITLRLSSILTWLMVQRSICAGKIPTEDASHYALDFQDICRVDNSMLHGVMPSYVCYLLDRSFELYERVVRLDGQAQRMH